MRVLFRSVRHPVQQCPSRCSNRGAPARHEPRRTARPAGPRLQKTRHHREGHTMNRLIWRTALAAMLLATAVSHAQEEAAADDVYEIAPEPDSRMPDGRRSEERRVGKECGRTCRSRWVANR